MSNYSITTQKTIRQMFRENYPELEFKKTEKLGYLDNGKAVFDYNCTTRSAFVEFVDGLHRDGVISDSLAFRVTL